MGGMGMGGRRGRGVSSGMGMGGMEGGMVGGRVGMDAAYNGYGGGYSPTSLRASEAKAAACAAVRAVGKLSEIVWQVFGEEQDAERQRLFLGLERRRSGRFG